MFFIVNPFIALHRGLKVLPIASTFKALRVKNLAAMMYSFDSLFFPNVILSPSLSNNESLVHYLDKSSISSRTESKKTKMGDSNNVINLFEKSKEKNKLFSQSLERKNPLALPITELSQGKNNPSKRRNNLFHNRGVAWKRPNQSQR